MATHDELPEQGEQGHEQAEQEQEQSGEAIVPFTIPARVPAEDLMRGDEVTVNDTDNGSEG